MFYYIALFFFVCGPLWAQTDPRCTPELTAKVTLPGAKMQVCVQTEQLIPKQPLVFTVQNVATATNDVIEGITVRIYDAKSVEQGKPEVIYQETGLGEELRQFKYQGSLVDHLIAKWHSQEGGFAIETLGWPGVGTLLVRVYSQAQKKFIPLPAAAANKKGREPVDRFVSAAGQTIEIRPGEIRVPTSDAGSLKRRWLVYRLKQGTYTAKVQRLPSSLNPKSETDLKGRKRVKVTF